MEHPGWPGLSGATDQLLAVVDEALKIPALPVKYQPWLDAGPESLARLMLLQPDPGYNLSLIHI